MQGVSEDGCIVSVGMKLYMYFVDLMVVFYEALREVLNWVM